MGDRRSLRVLSGVLAMLSGLGLAVVYGLGVLTARGQRVENRALESSNYAEQWRGVLDLVSVPALALALGLAVVLALAARRPRAALRAVIVVGGANLLGQVLKHGFLIRPDLAEYEAENTFPSGHAVAYASVLLAFVMIAGPRFRLAVATIATVVVSVVAVQLLGYGWHRLSDVVGGVLLATALAGLSGLLVPPSEREARWRIPRTARTLTIAGVVLFAVAAAALVAVAALRRDDHEAALLLLGTQSAAIGAVLLCTWLVALVAPTAAHASDRRAAVHLTRRRL